jgi:hypothetical protein
MEMADILPLVEHQLRSAGIQLRTTSKACTREWLCSFNLSAWNAVTKPRNDNRNSTPAIRNCLAESNILKTELRAMHQRFDDTLHYMNKRFDDTLHHMDRRFESMDKRFNLLTWMIGLGFTVVVTIASLYNFL